MDTEHKTGLVIERPCPWLQEIGCVPGQSLEDMLQGTSDTESCQQENPMDGLEHPVDGLEHPVDGVEHGAGVVDHQAGEARTESGGTQENILQPIVEELLDAKRPGTSSRPGNPRTQQVKLKITFVETMGNKVMVDREPRHCREYMSLEDVADEVEADLLKKQMSDLICLCNELIFELDLRDEKVEELEKTQKHNKILTFRYQQTIQAWAEKCQQMEEEMALGAPQTDCPCHTHNKHSRPAQEMYKMGGKTTKEMFKKDSKTAKEMFKKDSNTAKEMSKKDSKTAKEMSKKDSKTAQEMFKKDSKTAQEMFKKDSKTAQEMFKKDSTTAKEMSKKTSNTAKEMFKKDSKPAKEMSKKGSNTAKEMSKKYCKTAKQMFKKDSTASKMSKKDSIGDNDFSNGSKSYTVFPKDSKPAEKLSQADSQTTTEISQSDSKEATQISQTDSKPTTKILQTDCKPTTEISQTDGKEATQISQTDGKEATQISQTDSKTVTPISQTDSKPAKGVLPRFCKMIRQTFAPKRGHNIDHRTELGTFESEARRTAARTRADRKLTMPSLGLRPAGHQDGLSRPKLKEITGARELGPFCRRRYTELWVLALEEKQQ